TLVFCKSACSLLGGGTQSQKQGCMVGNIAGYQLRNASLALQVEHLACFIGNVFDRRWQPGPTMVAAQQAGLTQVVDIPPRRLLGDVEAARQRFNGNKALLLDQPDNLPLSQGQFIVMHCLPHFPLWPCGSCYTISVN